MRPPPHALLPPGDRHELRAATLPDEEARVFDYPELDRRTRGAYFTPAPLVRWVLERVLQHLPPGVQPALIDPACGAGAFLAGAAELLPEASLHGLELEPRVAADTADRLGRADLHVGNALQGGLSPLLSRLPADAFELWVGNPPYNGTSPLLLSPEAYRRARALLPPRFRLPAGTSLRDDFAFFLLLAAARISERGAGVLAFLTPSSLLDAFLYAPVREALLDALSLREVTDLGPGQFRHARVQTCLTVWTAKTKETAKGSRAAARFRSATGIIPSPLTAAQSLSPRAPSFLLRPKDRAAEALDEAWRTSGEALTTLIPVSFAGLKTRFDELLVDDDPERLLARVADFLATPAGALGEFAARHDLRPGLLSKLEFLKTFAPPDTLARRECVRPFIRYAGAKHRESVPGEAWGHCYLDRALIPRGDHRLQRLSEGRSYDPHAVDDKLLFNVRERPLSAARVSRAGCVHAHRHSRFAPLYVPRGLREGQTDFDPEALVPNLSEAGLRVAPEFGGVERLFDAICRFINSKSVQEVWAPAFASHSILPVPLDGTL